MRPRILRGRRLRPAIAPPRDGWRPADGLQLRPWTRTPNDVAAWRQATADLPTRLALNWPPRTAEQSLLHLVHRTRHTRLEQRDDFLALAVVVDGQIVGDVSAHLRDVDPDHLVFELGWVTLPEYRGRGYAELAAAALRDLLFRDHHAAWVTARVAFGNEPSEHVASALGMRPCRGFWSFDRERWEARTCIR